MIRNLSNVESDAWIELDRLYRPMIASWLRKYPLQISDREDIVQEVMGVILREITLFEHNGRAGAFRNWLRTTTVNLVRNYLRRKPPSPGAGTEQLLETLHQLEDPGSVAAQEFDREHEQHVVRRAVERVSKMFEPTTLQIFRLHVLEGVSIQETAGNTEGDSVGHLYGEITSASQDSSLCK